MQGYCTNTEYTGSLGYNLVCYITSRIRWVFKEKSEPDVPGYGGKKRLGGIKGCTVFKEKSEHYITSRNGWVSLKGIFRWYICSLLLHLGTEVLLKGILGGINVDVILEQYSTDQSPPGLLGTYKRLDGIKGCE